MPETMLLFSWNWLSGKRASERRKAERISKLKNDATEIQYDSHIRYKQHRFYLKRYK